MKKSIAPKEVESKHQMMMPEIKVELEPVFEVTTPAPDMSLIADAIEQIMLPKPNVVVNVSEEKESEKPKKVKIEVERDGRGFIKSLTCTEL